MARQLIFKHIKSASISFSPLSAGSTSARCLLEWVQRTKFRDENPSFSLKKEISSSIQSPSVTITFRDNYSMTFATERMAFRDILERVSKHSLRLEDTI